MESIEQYKKIEDLVQIPKHEKMGEFNKTVLRCADGSFKIFVAEMNELKPQKQKLVREAHKAMIQRNTLPVFSGNVRSYLVNQLADYELIC